MGASPRKTAVEARAVALDILNDVLIRRRPADEAFESHPDRSSLAGRDRAFALNLVATSLRRLGQIDAIILHLVHRPLPTRAAEARNVIRLGICQLVFLETPPHAAVNTAVALAGAAPRLRPYVSLINAVLRRAAAEAQAIAARQDAPRLNTPRWLWYGWTASYGSRTARDIAAAHLREPPLDLTPKRAFDPIAELEAVRLPTGSLRLRHKGPVVSLPGYAEGRWWVQDAAAALPARLFGPLAGRRVIDLCAAPGGKTAQLCAAGAEVTAVDHDAARLRRLQDNLDRLKLDARLVCADVRDWRPEQAADAVLLDAPCSATGTIRRHPDVAWLKGAADVIALSAIQARLLDAAIAMTRPGGTLIYCACSLQSEEGSALIDTLCAGRAGVERLAIGADEIGGLAEAITPAGDVRTLPCQLAALGGIDGFYIVRLRRL